VFMSEKWGHPAWYPDSRTITEAGNSFYSTDGDGKIARRPGLPKLGADHPSVSPDGKLYVMDGPLTNLEGKPGEWGVVVCDIRGEHYKILHRFNNSLGAKSWRKNHPHPIFSADGRRIYFNVNESEWTQLLVAECGTAFR